MPHPDQLTFADHVGQFYVRELDFPPVAGRLLGYLAICDPAAQSINELAETLLVSRSAIVQAVTMLETRGLARRARSRGDRVDKITAVIDVSTFEDDLDVSGYAGQAELLRQGSALLDAKDARRQSLKEIADFYDFISARLSQLKTEWQEHQAASQRTKRPS